MSWLFGRKTESNLPQPTPLQAQRTKQIETLKSFNQNVAEIQRDVEYRVNFTANGLNLSLHITLPPQFPQDKPVVKVTPPVSHGWLNEQGQVIGSPGLNSFVVHSDLGRVIRGVIEEFQHVPPTAIQTANNPYSGPPGLPYALTPQGPAPYMPYDGNSAPVSNYMASVPMPTLNAASAAPALSVAASTPIPNSISPAPSLPPYPQLNEHPVGHYQMPEIPSSFPEIRDLSVAELQELTENENSLLEHLQTLPQIKRLSDDRNDLGNKNEKLARDNLSQRPRIEQVKESLLQKFDELNDLRGSFDHDCQRQQELSSQCHPANIQSSLKMAALQAEEESEQIAEHFLEGKISIDQFINRFMEKRTLSHCRRAKEERLQGQTQRTGNY